MATPRAGILQGVPQQFLDGNGRPLAGGSVAYYVPGGQVLGSIWIDDQAATSCQNPSPLSASGQPTSGGGTVTIYGSGVYRQDVRDVNGQLIDSQLVQDEVSIVQEVAIATGTGGYYLIDSGTVNNVQVTLPAGAPTALADLIGIPLRILCKNTASGPSTLAISGLGGPTPILFPGGGTLGLGALQAGGISTLVYDGTNFELVGFSINFPALTVNSFFYAPSMSPTQEIPAAMGPLSVFQTNTSFYLNVPTALSNLPVFADVAMLVQFTSSTGNGIDPSVASPRVGAVIGITAETNSGNVTALETNTIVKSGACSVGGVVGAEFDLTNVAGHDYGNTVGAAGIAQPAAYGVVISGDSTSKNTGALLISGLIAGQWNRGIVFDTGTAIVQSEIEGYSTCTAGYLIGGTKAVGLDTTTGTFSGAAIRLGNGQYLAGVNAAANNQYNLIGLNASDQVVVGQGGSTVATVNTLSTTATQPGVDNVQSLGGASNRWTVVYAVNGSINTSDPELKTEIGRPPAGVLEMVQAIKPITFKWKEGGFEQIEVEVEAEVGLEDEVEVATSRVEVGPDGKAILRTGKEVRKVPRYIEVPVYLPDGSPAEEIVPAKPEIWGERNGQRVLLREAQPEIRRPLMHRVQARETRKVKKSEARAKPGKRLHWGFDATEIKRIIDAKGVDFGGFVDPAVSGQSGPLGLRPSQLLAMLWAGFQEHLEQQRTEITSLRLEIEQLKAAKP